MGQAFFMVILSVFQAINHVYEWIFPLFPPLGSLILALGVLLFIVYVFKSGFGQAIKISFGFIFILTLLAYFISKMLKLFAVL